MGARRSPAMNPSRHAKSSARGRSIPPTIPLIPATRPLTSTSSAAARPMTAPPIAADQGVKLIQSMLMADASSVLEIGFALADERAHAFLQVFQCKRRVKLAPLEQQAVRERRLVGAVDRLLDLEHHGQ